MVCSPAASRLLHHRVHSPPHPHLPRHRPLANRIRVLRSTAARSPAFPAPRRRSTLAGVLVLCASTEAGRKPALPLHKHGLSLGESRRTGSSAYEFLGRCKPPSASLQLSKIKAFTAHRDTVAECAWGSSMWTKQAAEPGPSLGGDGEKQPIPTVRRAHRRATEAASASVRQRNMNSDFVVHTARLSVFPPISRPSPPPAIAGPHAASGSPHAMALQGKKLINNPDGNSLLLHFPHFSLNFGQFFFDC
ncbi:hypothetical protein HU200_014529 [Digitaria exilis]|uniref:Uncharacterized protein n=1 Tax=Digitaria exilis TaxID=1010633 RepID=A0A835FCJ3_9POAL|nr:hypothetical protein HU200_014529 [Digitaria exilis]